MARSRLLLIGFTLWLTLLFNLERPDFFGLERINLDSVVYVIAAGATVAMLVLPDLGKRPGVMFAIVFVIYGASKIIRADLTATPASTITSILEIILLSVTLWLARTVSLALASFEQAVENVVLNPNSSRILPMAEGEEKVNNELFRARRFDRPVAFILIRITSLEGMRPKAGERFDLETAFQRRYLQIRIAQVAEATLYRSDLITWNTDNLVICLPETNRGEALQQAKLIHTLIRIRLNIDVPIGIAAFPEDGLIYRDLVDAALLNRLTFDEPALPSSSSGGSSGTSSRGDTEIREKSMENNQTPLADRMPRTTPKTETKTEHQSTVQSIIGLFSHRHSHPVTEKSPKVSGEIRYYYDPDFWINKLPYQSASSRLLYGAIKRAIDIGLVLLVAPIVLPLAGLVALAIYMEDGRPLLFSQPRTGLGGKTFKMYKFRSMIPNAQQRLKEMGVTVNERNETVDQSGAKLKRDPRVTRVGAIIRKTSLDEIPQLWNIFQGHMSIVGPRPTSFGVDMYTLIQTQRLSVRPGLTGLWQIYARGSTDFNDRLFWDMKYIDKMSFTVDMYIMLRTALQFLNQRGAR